MSQISNVNSCKGMFYFFSLQVLTIFLFHSTHNDMQHFIFRVLISFLSFQVNYYLQQHTMYIRHTMYNGQWTMYVTGWMTQDIGIGHTTDNNPYSFFVFILFFNILSIYYGPDYQQTATSQLQVYNSHKDSDVDDKRQVWFYVELSVSVRVTPLLSYIKCKICTTVIIYIYVSLLLINHLFENPWVTQTPTCETLDPLPWVGVLTGRVGVGLVDPRVIRDNP